MIRVGKPKVPKRVWETVFFLRARSCGSWLGCWWKAGPADMATEKSEVLGLKRFSLLVWSSSWFWPTGPGARRVAHEIQPHRTEGASAMSMTTP